ncbi:MAG: sodium:calcium antiporter [Bdellovibrionota bacterium]
MTGVLIQFLISASVVIVAGLILTKCADRIAEVTGFGRALIGSILLAGATSLPELMVDINAIRSIQPDLAVGDLLGSSLLNLLILALLDSLFRHPRRSFSNEFASHAQTAILSINLTALVGIGILAQLSVSIFGVGIFMWIVGFVYLIGIKLNFSHQSTNTNRFTWKNTLATPIIGFIGSTVMISLAAPYLVQAADELATITRLGHSFVGTTFVALATSLPELVATLAAFRMRTPDLALGNIFGSNTFNMILFFPLDVLYPGILLSSVRPMHALTAFCIVAVSSVAVLGQVSRKREKTRLWEPSSELIVLMTLGSLYLLYYVK